MSGGMEASRRNRDETHALIDGFTGPQEIKNHAKIVALRGDTAGLRSRYAEAAEHYRRAREIIREGDTGDSR